MLNIASELTLKYRFEYKYQLVARTSFRCSSRWVWYGKHGWGLVSVRFSRIGHGLRETCCESSANGEKRRSPVFKAENLITDICSKKCALLDSALLPFRRPVSFVFVCVGRILNPHREAFQPESAHVQVNKSNRQKMKDLEWNNTQNQQLPPYLGLGQRSSTT